MRTSPVPKYRHHKARDLAVVRIDGKDRYLGKFNSPESHVKYRRLLVKYCQGSLRRPEQGGQYCSFFGTHIIPSYGK